MKKRLRDNKGRFISGEKEDIIRQMAKANNKNAHSYLKQNFDILSGFIKDTKIEYSFNQDNFESALKGKTILINGKKVSKGEALIAIQKTVTDIKKNYNSAYIQFNAELINKKSGTKEKYKKNRYNKINIKLPEPKKRGENMDDYLERIEDEILIYGS